MKPFKSIFALLLILMLIPAFFDPTAHDGFVLFC
jgi:hypothetical protein